MKKLLFLLSVLLLVGMIAPVRADVTPSQIVKEYKVGDKTYCLVKRSDFYRLTRPEMNAAWEKFWESGDFLEYESNARRTLLLRDEAKLRITGISGNDELERIIRSVYTPEEIEKYAAAKTSDMRGIFLYILCDYTGKIVSIAMGGIGTDSLDNLHPSALNGGEIRPPDRGDRETVEGRALLQGESGTVLPDLCGRYFPFQVVP